MGYSGRYHAASLAAVFIALAIGILIGIGLADDVVSTASQELEQSLRDERDQAQDEADDLRGDLDTEQQFSDDAYPALVDGKLERDRFAVVEIGSVPDDGVEDTADEAIDAAVQGGGELASVSKIEIPLDYAALADAVGGDLKDVRRNPKELERLGERVGSSLASGGDLADRVKTELFAGFNGSLDGVNHLILIRNPAGDLSDGEQSMYDAFEKGLIEGAADRAVGIVGVERTSTDPSTVGVFSDLGVPTVDHVDTTAGKVAIVFALDGSQGDFGTKEDATSLLPDLIPGRPSQ